MKNLILAIFFTFVFAGTGLGAPPPQDQRKEVSLHYYRGVVNFEAGRYENALAEFQEVVVIDPYYKDTQKYMEESVNLLEQYRDSMFSKEEAEKLKNKDFDLYFLGKSYYEKGDYHRALEAFKAVLEKNPNDKFALYYAQLCRNALSGGVEAAKKSKKPHREELGLNVSELEKEVSYVKADIRGQEDLQASLEDKAQRRAEREELVMKKEKQLKEQEELLEEEKQDYLAQAKITKRAEKVMRDTEKWKNMKERLAFSQPGTPAALSEFPVCLDMAQRYYVSMKEALRTSRWNSAGLNAIDASIYYGDAVLIYFYGVRSAYPKHENINRLLSAHVKRSDVDENIFRMRSILNLKSIVESEDRPITRSEAIFLAEKSEKLIEWCKALLP